MVEVFTCWLGDILVLRPCGGTGEGGNGGGASHCWSGGLREVQKWMEVRWGWKTGELKWVEAWRRRWERKRSGVGMG